MKSAASENVVKPADCVLAFGIPTTRAGFDARRCQPNADFVDLFVHRNDAPWDTYYKQVVSVVEEVEPVYTNLGVRVVHHVTLKQFGTLFNDEAHAVVILFSHWIPGAVEFYDGLADIESVIDQVPRDYSGTIDLCVCHPKDLVSRLRDHCPYCSIRSTDKKATPFYWLYFYEKLFRDLFQKDLTYRQAFEDALLEVEARGRLRRRLRKKLDRCLEKLGDVY